MLILLALAASGAVGDHTLLLAFITALTLAVAFSIIYAIFDKRHKILKRLPAYAPASMWQNIQAAMVQKSLHQDNYKKKFLEEVDTLSAL
jgi:hypothetical protein